jgi:hypothetical protein
MTENTPSTKRSVFIVAAAVLLSVLFPAVAVLTGAFDSANVRVLEDGIYGESPEHFEEDSVAIYVQMLAFDASTQRAEMAYYPWPTSDLAQQFSSSVLGKTDVRVFVDSQNSTLHEFPAGSQIGGVEATVDVLSSDYPERASDSLYPFDLYVMDSYARVENRGSEQDEYAPIQTFDYFYTSPVAGFDITYQRLAAFDSAYPGLEESRNLERIAIERSEGKASFLVFIERSFAVKAIAVFIYLFVFIAGLTQAWVFYMIASGKRPPSMDALTWAAALLLGIVQLRMLAPGDPRIGVYADLVVYFPALILSLAALAGTTYLWNTRKDFIPKS